MLVQLADKDERTIFVTINKNIFSLTLSTSMMQAEAFRMVAKTLYGLEHILAKELEQLGAANIEIGRRMVSFTGDKRLLYQANLWLRTALRILKPVFTCRASNPDELYRELSKKDWSTIMTSKNTFSIDTTVNSEGFTHSKYVSYRTKDAIVDFFLQREQTRPSVRLDNPDIPLNVHISHDEVTISLDSSGDSLHKRGYRAVQTDAPISEVLAAGILLMAGWDGQTDLIDPMCGSGTFLIEAGLIARNIAPGIYRQRAFAFERWSDFDQALFEELYNDDSAERPFHHKIYGGDILREAISISQRNVDRAGLGRDITLEVLPMENRPQPTNPALIVMNPPYGERLKLRDANALYGMIGERLKHNYSGCTAWVLAYNPDHFAQIGLRPSSKTKLINGSLECELRSYELFAGKRDEYKAGRESKREFKGSRASNLERERKFPRRERREFGKEKLKERKRDFPKDTRGSRKKTESSTPWPNSRFRYVDEQGVERVRPKRNQRFVAYHADKDN